MSSTARGVAARWGEGRLRSRGPRGPEVGDPPVVALGGGLPERRHRLMQVAGAALDLAELHQEFAPTAVVRRLHQVERCSPVVDGFFPGEDCGGALPARRQCAIVFRDPPTARRGGSGPPVSPRALPSRRPEHPRWPRRHAGGAADGVECHPVVDGLADQGVGEVIGVALLAEDAGPERFLHSVEQPRFFDVGDGDVRETEAIAQDRRDLKHPVRFWDSAARAAVR